MRKIRACETVKRQSDVGLDVTGPSGYRDRGVWSRTHSRDCGSQADRWATAALETLEPPPIELSYGTPAGARREYSHLVARCAAHQSLKGRPTSMVL